MKRTELERKERELKKQEKKLTRNESGSDGKSVNDYIDELFALLRYDASELYNTADDMNILELFEVMKNDLPENQWENVIKKAIRKTKVAEREKAIAVLDELLKM